MTAFKAFDVVYAAACQLLPAQMDSLEAKAMLIAIALQESRFEHRVQMQGTAHGFWQFELGGGVRGVLNHPTTHYHILSVLDDLEYDELPITSYNAIEHNDILACAYARLLLWTLPDPLTQRGEPDRAWLQYLNAWRPGKPIRETWNIFYRQAWDFVEGIFE